MPTRQILIKVLSHYPEIFLMMNLKTIEQKLDEGSLEDAENAIEDLLALALTILLR